MLLDWVSVVMDIYSINTC